MATKNSQFDRDMAAVLRKPGPAIASLLAGAVIGVTGGAALAGGGGDDPPPASVPVAQAPEKTPDKGNGNKPPKKPKTPTATPTPKPPKQVEKGFDGAIAAVEKFVAGKDIGVAILPLRGGEQFTAGKTGERKGWSTLKIPVIATFLTYMQPGSEDLGNIERAIVNSDNLAVRSLYKKLLGTPPNVAKAEGMLQTVLGQGGAAVSGMPQTTDPSLDNSVAFGEALWNPVQAAMFFKALACGEVVSAEHTDLILRHMKNIGGEGHFGAMNVFSNVASKGGWSGPTVHQVAIVGGDDDAFVLSVMTEGQALPGGGQRIAEVAKRVKASVNPGGDPAAASC